MSIAPAESVPCASPKKHGVAEVGEGLWPMVGKGLASETQIGAYTGESRLIELRSPPNNLHKGTRGAGWRE